MALLERIAFIRERYGSVAKARNAILSSRLSILDEAIDTLIGAMIPIEDGILDVVLDVLFSMDAIDGKLQPSSDNKSKLSKLNSGLKKLIDESSYESDVKKYLDNYDVIENLSKQHFEAEHYEKGWEAFGVFDVSEDKKIFTEGVIDGLLTGSARRREIRDPIRKILYQHIRSGVSIKEAESQLRSFIAGDEKIGYLQRYAGQLARDAINQFDGAIQVEAINQYNLTHWDIVGSLIATSRQNCIDTVDGIGAIGKFRNKNGWYRIADIPKIIDIAKGGAGWNDLTTTETFPIYRYGFNCRHGFIATIDPDDDLTKPIN